MSNKDWLGAIFFISIIIAMFLMLMISAKTLRWSWLVENSDFGSVNKNTEKFYFSSAAISYKNGIYFNLRGFCKIEIGDHGILVSIHFPISLIFQPVFISWDNISTIERDGKFGPIVTIHDSTGMYRISLIGRAAEALEKRGSQLNKMAAKA